MGKGKNHFPILSKKDLKKIKKIKIDGNKTVYFDTIKTSSEHPNFESSLTYWRLKTQEWWKSLNREGRTTDRHDLVRG
jgi:hypothetical protein